MTTTRMMMVLLSWSERRGSKGGRAPARPPSRVRPRDGRGLFAPFFLTIPSPLIRARLDMLEEPGRGAESPPPNVKLPEAEATANPPSDDLSILASLNRAAARPASKSPLWSRKAGEGNVVRSRQGSVLTRGLVLKTDHFEGTRVRPSKLDLSLQGAPNFRKADAPLEVYGTAQPTITGLRTILAVLGAAPPVAPSSLNKRPWQRTPSGMALKSPPASRQASHHLHTASAVPSPAPVESPDLRPSLQTVKRTTVWVCTREEPM